MRSEIETRLRHDAAADADFRAALLTDPSGAIADRYGIGIPDGITVRVVEESADEAILVLPATDSPALSEAELELVMGGAGFSEPGGYCSG